MARPRSLGALFSHLLSEESWLIHEKGWNPSQQKVQESLFTLGNGYLSSRGILEEIPFDATPGTFIAGLYDKAPAQVPELVNLPNPVDFHVAVEGEKLGVVAMDVLKHKRTLDMKKGLLVRHTVYANARRQRFDYQSIRFVSMHNPYLLAMRVFLTPLDSDADFIVQSVLNTSVTNQGMLTEGRKRHYIEEELASLKDTRYTSVELLDRDVRVGYGSHLSFAYGRKRFTTIERLSLLKIKKGETLRITKFFWIQTSREISLDRLKIHVVRKLRHVAQRGFEKALSDHIHAFHQRWEMADINLKPDLKLQRALRFNLYHLLICTRKEDYDVSIGARTLSGEGYRGHIFWDCEIFILPFFIFTQPKIAKNMLLYRYRRLPQARKNARRRGYRGAFFPWESADTGEDVTPDWHKDLDGKIVPVRTGELEHHIVADIAYAVYQYYQVTGDHRFILEAGLEILFETARFWASRVYYNKRRDLYEIRNVIGPDEFHVGVNNNAYTNGMAAWNLRTASRFYRQVRRRQSKVTRRLLRRIRLVEKEVRHWEQIAAKLNFSRDRTRILISPFDGYFQKRYVSLDKRSRYATPLFPRHISPKEVHRTQLIKQTDVVMLMYLLGDQFTPREKRVNFQYYDKRTVHKSSLSPSIHATIALHTGHREEGYRYFLASLFADLKNRHRNTEGGIHAASLGGTWQAVANGFCGLNVTDDCLSLDPVLPKRLNEIRFKIWFRGALLAISVRDGRVAFRVLSKGFRHFRVSAFGRSRVVLNQKRLVFVNKS